MEKKYFKIEHQSCATFHIPGLWASQQFSKGHMVTPHLRRGAELPWYSLMVGREARELGVKFRLTQITAVMNSKGDELSEGDRNNESQGSEPAPGEKSEVAS